MRITVSAWDPSYADSSESMTHAARAKLDLALELPPHAWEPITASPDVPPPPRVMLVDGVRRLDARVDIALDGHPPQPGLCASYAAGVVVCDLAGRVPTANLAHSTIARGLFSQEPGEGMHAGRLAHYAPQRVTVQEPADLINAVQDRLSAIEVAVSTRAQPTDSDLLVLDGALRRRGHLPRAVGYIKSHQRSYLPDELHSVVGGLSAGQRTPIFGLATTWQRHSWYLRLPGGGDNAWAGIARLEASADLSVRAVVELANASARVLPQLSSAPHKDPRAPQNLTPIAGLERALRMKLGDPTLLLRRLRASSNPGDSASSPRGDML